ncbi:MAG: hypothetical protein O7E57_05600 [Gammaproteobacteria bacterium]|nr:hypothetical protein [Gammaproteobacteria bacterium]
MANLLDGKGPFKEEVRQFLQEDQAKYTTLGQNLLTPFREILRILR